MSSDRATRSKDKAKVAQLRLASPEPEQVLVAGLSPEPEPRPDVPALQDVVPGGFVSVKVKVQSVKHVEGDLPRAELLITDGRLLAKAIAFGAMANPVSQNVKAGRCYEFRGLKPNERRRIFSGRPSTTLTSSSRLVERQRVNRISKLLIRFDKLPLFLNQLGTQLVLTDITASLYSSCPICNSGVVFVDESVVCSRQGCHPDSAVGAKTRFVGEVTIGESTVVLRLFSEVCEHLLGPVYQALLDAYDDGGFKEALQQLIGGKEVEFYARRSSKRFQSFPCGPVDILLLVMP